MMYEDLEFYTRFTITLHDALIKEPTLLDNLTLSTPERTSAFKKMFINRWDIYEIGVETIPMFKYIIENKFNILKDMYEELLTAYETKIDMLDGEKETITRDDVKKENGTKTTDLTGNVSTTATITDDTTTTTTNTGTVSKDSNENKSHFDLPRTNTNQDKPSSKDSSTYGDTVTNDLSENLTGKNTNKTDNKTTNTANTSTADNKDATLKQTITKTGGVNVISLKRDYMSLIRNVLLDFVNEFDKCFLDIYY